MLKDKNIIVGITGSIAAYKAAILVSGLRKAGANVKVILTKAASHFVTPLTLSTITGNAVLSSFYKEDGSWVNHVELGMWADIFVIAPSSANTLAKCATGICDNLLLATYLSAKCKVMFFPAMDLDMYAHQSTQANINKLQSYGNYVGEAPSGKLASGLSGPGRLQEPETIIEIITQHFKSQYTSKIALPLKGKHVLITSGPTREVIDPVRYISNYSTGKMGAALAQSALDAGANVTIVTGPVNINYPNDCQVIQTTSAQDMATEVAKLIPKVDIFIAAAAVADYRLLNIYTEKVKKEESENLTLTLVKNKDILADVGLNKLLGQIVVGFALETHNLLANGIEKLKRKNLDLIVINSATDPGSGFGGDTNRISIVDRLGNVDDSGLITKKEASSKIIQHIISLL